jgi:hypothetical protein
MTIIISTGKIVCDRNLESQVMREREKLVDAISQVTSKVCTAEVDWAKNYFVSSQNRIYSRKKHGFYADGGHIIPTQRVTFACANVKTEEQTPQQRYAKLTTMYGEHVIVPEPGEWHKSISPHIDLVLLPIPEHDLLFVDTKYYTLHKDCIDVIGKKYQFEICPLPQDYDKPQYPCNSLVIREDDSVFIIGNQHNEFERQLQNKHLEHKLISFRTNALSGGSTACATNYCVKAKIAEALTILEQKPQ